MLYQGELKKERLTQRKREKDCARHALSEAKSRSARATRRRETDHVDWQDNETQSALYCKRELKRQKETSKERKREKKKKKGIENTERTKKGVEKDR